MDTLGEGQSMKQLLVATTNRGKLVEYQAMLEELPVELLTLADVGITEEIPETGSTYVENARLKAEGYARLSNMLTLADDSGLEVAALNGEPGVYSARYGGETTDAGRIRLLLEKLSGAPFHERLARFVCVIAIATPDDGIETVEGTVGGVIEFSPRGNGGFGYDPVFTLLDRGVTMAELPPEEKNTISHRAVALRKARSLLDSRFGIAAEATHN
jgi:XTP/dITP diphosphohydrolase